MHSSTNNSIRSGTIYPFPPYNFPFSSSSSSSSHINHHPLLPQENTTFGGIFGLHHDQFSLLNNCLIAPGPESTMINIVGGASSNAIISSPGDYQQHYGYEINNNITHPYFVSKEVKVPAVANAKTKDRHSKIFTSQGFRDRRVRLSINVAREFFDLQELLGFDKASKTLQWLLSKSRNAIQDLEKSKCINSNSLSSSSTSDCDDVLDINDEVSKYKRKMKEAAAIMAKESRTKARARARERTREKMCRTGTSKRSPQISSQLSLFNELEPADMNQEPGSILLSDSQAEYNESALKRKLKSPSVDRSPEMNPQRTEASSNCCSHINIQFPGAISQNWDINGAVFACPSICAITTNMNLNSTGF